MNPLFHLRGSRSWRHTVGFSAIPPIQFLLKETKLLGSLKLRGGHFTRA